MSDSASCRILVVSPTAVRAHQFVERVQALTASRHGTPGASTGGATGIPGQTSVSTSRDPLAAGSSTSIPWTIVNKYYTADVHFETHEFEQFRVHHAVGVPAIIYVWGPGEPYREHIPEIAQKVQHYDPEVSLAVRFGESSSISSPAPPSVDEEGLDDFLATHGFEFIEGDRAHRRPTQDTERNSDDEDSGVPGLPRVLDALSTIMWPSLVQSDATRKRKSRARDLIGWALEEEADDGLRALIADPSASAASSDPANSIAAAAAQRKSRMQREMEELERWLEDEETDSGTKYGRGNPEGTSVNPPAALEKAEDEDARIWVSSAPVSSTEGWEDMMTPPAIRTPRPDDEHHGDSLSEHGFEDDFADFVSATSHPHLHVPGRGLGPSDERLLEVNYDVGRLTPMHTGMSYRSLASMSDFGGDDSMFVAHDVEYGTLNDNDDPDLPSSAEILETSRRIFGAAAFSPVPDASTSNTSGPSTNPAATEGSSSSTATPAHAPPRPAAASADSSIDLSLDSEEGEADESFAAFDLSRVFSALQGMKEEIAGMGNEDERRRAAARVALGLVYGLSGGGEKPEQAASAVVQSHDA
ncbi:hypothetical protein L226DRAFT_532275 [Lentinus tigrinus ALCF2SS1-7]|uniref:Uncharacterized protein n=1 Tax=Lentinus tigrinus ALCF2SS1-6 TaxID=1328759 RepID=A0A5C2SHM3_9APHY|nr:hypothetical protein L227DRAFT_573269 [Lentinus tigrinus ALCF2SS1-6]RPD77491.1 hypothetical protein L226DRAFT_532275 [Lentinus tigrinus ALCF2SS1-7]